MLSSLQHVTRMGLQQRGRLRENGLAVATISSRAPFGGMGLQLLSTAAAGRQWKDGLAAAINSSDRATSEVSPFKSYQQQQQGDSEVWLFKSYQQQQRGDSEVWLFKSYLSAAAAGGL